MKKVEVQLLDQVLINEAKNINQLLKEVENGRGMKAPSQQLIK